MDTPPQAQPLDASPQETGDTTRAASPTPTLDGLLATLSEQIAALAERIELDQSAVRSASAQHRQLQSDVSQLKRTAESVSASRDEARKVLTEATTTQASVKDRIDALPAGETEQIDTELGKIDSSIEAKATALSEAENRLATLRQEEADLERQAQEQNHAFEQALNHLSALPRELGALVSPLRRLTTEIKAAADAGHDRKVYVLSTELNARIAALEELLKDEQVAARVGAWEQARTALADARQAQDAKAGEVAAQESVVARLRKELDAARAARKDQIKALVVAPKDAAPVAAPA